METTRKLRLPKRVMGVKVPKVIRKSEAIDTILNNPIARAALAEALVAAAAAAAAVLVRQGPAAESMKRAGKATSGAAGDLGSAAKEVAKGAAGAVAGVVVEAGRKILAGTDDQAGSRAPHRNRSQDPQSEKKGASRH